MDSSTFIARGRPRFEQTYDANDWLRMLMELGAGGLMAGQWAQAFADEVQPGRFSAGMFDVRAFVAQFLHETAMLKRMQEDMNYSPERISAVWPHRFPRPMDALPYAKAPERLANSVYANRMGNGDEASGDGWSYRGRGAGITGRANYIWLGEVWGQDLETNPNLIEQPHYALEAFFHWWEGHIPDKSLSDQVKVRKLVQGGDEGLPHCEQLYANACKVLA